MPEILSIGELLDLGNSASTAGMIPYSALEYNGSGDISGISGSAIAGGVDSAVVSSIVSSYVESGVSGKVDQTAFDNCCSSVQSALSGKLDKSASGQFQPIGDYYSASNPSGFITGVDLSEYQEKSSMTAYQSAGDYYSASNPSGFITGVDLSDYAKESSLSGKLDASASSQFQPSGNYVYESSYSSFSGDVVNNISSMSSIVSGLTGDYLDKSASSMFAPSGNYALSSDVSSTVNVVANNSAIWGQGGGGGDDYTGITPIVVDNTARTVGMSSVQLDVDETMTSYLSGGVTYFGVNESALNLTSKQDASAMSAYALSADVSSVINTVSNNSGSWGGGGGGGGGDYVEKSAMDVRIGSGGSVSYTSLNQGDANIATYYSLAQGTKNYARSASLAQGSSNTAKEASIAQGESNVAETHSLAQGVSNSANMNSFIQGLRNTAYNASFIQGADNSASSNAVAFGSNNRVSSYSFAQGIYNRASSYSVALGEYNSASSHAFAYGYHLSAASYAAVFGKNNLKGHGQTDNVAFVIGDGASTSNRHDLMHVTKDGELTMYSSTSDVLGYKLVSTLKALSAWATANGWTGAS